MTCLIFEKNNCQIILQKRAKALILRPISAAEVQEVPAKRVDHLTEKRIKARLNVRYC